MGLQKNVLSHLKHLIKSKYLLIVTVLFFFCDTNSSGGHQPPIPPGPDFFEFPRWNIDGNKILYYSYGVTEVFENDWITNPDSTGIWIYDFELGSSKKLFNAYFANWSPDNEWIVFSSQSHIYKIRYANNDIIDSTLVKLTEVGSNTLPAWSPDGQKIAFYKTVADSEGERGIWIMDHQGNDKERLFLGGYPNWDSSSTKIVGTSSNNILIYDLLSGKIEITYPVNNASRVISPTFINEDSQVIVQADGDIVKINLINSKSEKISDGQYPDWSSIRERILYKDVQIYTMDLMGNNKNQLIFN